MNALTTAEDPHVDRTTDVRDELQERWHGWSSPIGLGVGLVCVGGFFVQLALGLSILDSIG